MGGVRVLTEASLRALRMETRLKELVTLMVGGVKPLTPYRVLAKMREGLEEAMKGTLKLEFPLSRYFLNGWGRS